MGGRSIILHIHKHREVDIGKVVTDFANVKDRCCLFACKQSDNNLFIYFCLVREQAEF